MLAPKKTLHLSHAQLVQPEPSRLSLISRCPQPNDFRSDKKKPQQQKINSLDHYLILLGAGKTLHLSHAQLVQPEPSRLRIAPLIGIVPYHSIEHG